MFFCSSANAQGYPARPVRIVVPVSTGGATDILTRTLVQDEIVQALFAFGLEPAASNSPEDFTAFVHSEIGKWAKVVKASGAKAD